MKPVTDDELRAQLTRRAGSPPPSSATAAPPATVERGRALAALVSERVVSERQGRAWPWDRVRQPRALRGFGSPWPAVSGAVAVVAILALGAAILPGRLAGPAATPATAAWYLTTDELAAVVARTATSSEDVGKTIVANVKITDLAASCAPPADGSSPLAVSCAEQVLAGTDPPIPVQNAQLPISCPAPSSRCYVLPSPGSTALTIEPGSVTYVETVDLGTTDHAPWSVGRYLTTSTSGLDVALVDGWLSTMGIPPGCPAPMPSVPENGPYTCGAATWLTADPFRATIGGGGSYETTAPGRGIRVQNSAYGTFASTPSATDPDGFPASVRGLFVVLPLTAPDPCFMCSTAVGQLLARVDAVSIPTSSQAPEPTSEATSAWYLTTDQLARVVAGTATSSASLGKTIVANVSFVDLNATCSTLVPSAGCGLDPAIAGTDPPIRVSGAIIIGRCMFTPGQRPPNGCEFLPAAGSVALTIGPGYVTFVGSVAMAAGDPPWSVDQWLDRSEAAATYPYLGFSTALVHSWLSSGFAPPCPLPPNGVDPNAPWGCGVPAWLTADPFRPVTGAAGSTEMVEPGRGIRVQNDAYEAFAPSRGTLSSDGLPVAEEGLFLVGPAWPAPASCFLCATGVTQILARVDPVDVPAALPSPVAHQTEGAQPSAPDILR